MDYYSVQAFKHFDEGPAVLLQLSDQKQTKQQDYP